MGFGFGGQCVCVCVCGDGWWVDWGGGGRGGGGGAGFGAGFCRALHVPPVSNTPLGHGNMKHGGNFTWPHGGQRRLSAAGRSA